jgi:hypothetical protein
MLTRTILLILLLVAVVTFADWIASPLGPCETPIQHGSESGKKNESGKEDCSTGKIIAFWRGTGQLVDVWHDDLTAAATVVIAIFTTILGVFTVNLAHSTRIAADAAKRAADTAVNVELPILIISRASLQVIPTGGTARNLKVDENIPERFDPIIWFTNYGRSPAQVTAGCLQSQVATAAGELPLPPKYSNIAPYPSNAVFKEDAFVRLDVPCVIEPKPCEILALNKSEKFLWVFGYITFRDFLDGPHESRFCLKWSRQREGSSGPFGFVWDSETTAEYTKRT